MPRKKKQEEPKEIVCVVECPDGFNDFSILKQSVPKGGRVEVNDSQWGQMKMSSPTCVLVERRMPLGSEASKKIAEEVAKKEAEKAAIRAKYEKDAPPRRKVGKPAPLPNTDTSRPVSQAEMVHLPVTEKKDD